MLDIATMLTFKVAKCR